MKFAIHTFSKRFPPIECAVFVMHEAPTAYRATAAAVILPTGWVYVGVSVCSAKDQFIKTVGREKALGRAFQQLHLQEGRRLGVDIGAPELAEALKALLVECIAEHKTTMRVS